MHQNNTPHRTEDMEVYIASVLKRFNAPVPAGLSRAIFFRMTTEERRAARTRFAVSVSAAVFSGVLLVPAAIYAAHAFELSGFGNYASLILSDSDVVFGNLSAFLLSLAESLPAIAVAAFTAVVLMFLSSTTLAIRTGRNRMWRTHMTTRSA